jgi:hypothetical protein
LTEELFLSHRVVGTDQRETRFHGGRKGPRRPEKVHVGFFQKQQRVSLEEDARLQIHRCNFGYPGILLNPG